MWNIFLMECFQPQGRNLLKGTGRRADFRDYAEVCFKEFGDRVKHWMTINELAQFGIGGYALGIIAPGRCSDLDKCYAGDSCQEPYIVGHHHLLAHAAAVKIYKDKYQASQKGIIVIILATN